MATPLGAGYITVAFIAARLAAPSVGGTAGTASLNGVATLNAQPSVQRSASLTATANLSGTSSIFNIRTSSITGYGVLSATATVVNPTNLLSSIVGVGTLSATPATQASSSITGNGNVTALRSTQLQSSIVGIASINAVGTTANPTYLNSAIVGTSNVTADVSFVRTSSIRGIATIISYPISPTTPAQPLFANIRGIANVIADGYIPSICECPPWNVPATLSNSWLTNTVQCLDGQADLPFTLPIFRLYDLSEVISGSEYHRGVSINCTISNGREAVLPYTLPIFRMYSISNLISSRGYYRNDSTSCTTTRDGTLSKQFTRKGCL
jgi:hypothetical protein